MNKTTIRRITALAVILILMTAHTFTAYAENSGTGATANGADNIDAVIHRSVAPLSGGETVLLAVVTATAALTLVAAAVVVIVSFRRKKSSGGGSL